MRGADRRTSLLSELSLYLEMGGAGRGTLDRIGPQGHRLVPMTPQLLILLVGILLAILNLTVGKPAIGWSVLILYGAMLWRL